MTMKYLVRFNKLNVPNHKSIMAIKLLREATGCKLLSAKKVITGHRGDGPKSAIVTGEQLEELYRLQGRTIGASFKSCGYGLDVLDKYLEG